jgi:GNAT superfamily N-acetyltransferase
LNKRPTVTLDSWRADDPRWMEWRAYAEAAGLVHGIIDEHGLKPDSHFLAALLDGQLVGVLMFLIQPIGPEMDVPAICDGEGEPLTEAKIRAFHVLPSYRNQGIGTALQQRAVEMARHLGCYQVRSRSELTAQSNYAVKRKLGFAMHPSVRTFGDGRTSVGVYWVKKV